MQSFQNLMIALKHHNSNAVLRRIVIYHQDSKLNDFHVKSNCINLANWLQVKIIKAKKEIIFTLFKLLAYWFVDVKLISNRIVQMFLGLFFSKFKIMEITIITLSSFPAAWLPKWSLYLLGYLLCRRTIFAGHTAVFKKMNSLHLRHYNSLVWS